MGWSGSDFQRTHNFSADASAGINILASRFDEEFDNFETGLEACLKLDGTNSPNNDFSMGGFKHTDVGPATSTNEYLRLDQFQQLTPILCSFGGTSDVFSVSTFPVFNALVSGHTILVSCPSANTTTSVVIKLNGLSSVPVKQPDGSPPSIGDVKGLRQYVYNGSQFILMNSGGPSYATSHLLGYGAIGDGVTDDSAALTAALTVGGSIFIPEGYTFYVPTISQFTVSANIRLFGGGTIKSGAGVYLFKPAGGDIVLEDIVFDTFAGIIESDVADSGTTDIMRIQNCKFLNMAALTIDHERPINSALIEGCLFDTVNGESVRIGKNDYSLQDTWKKIVIRGNRWDDVSSSGTDSACAAIVYGKEVIITGNFVFDIDASAGSGEAWGFYTKARKTIIANNEIISVVGAGGAGQQVGINIKGSERGTVTAPQGFNTIVTGNYIESPGGYGIRAQSDEIIIASNIVEEPGDSAFALDSLGSNVVLNGNKGFVTTEGTSMGIRCTWNGDAIQLSNNILEGFHSCIRISVLAGETQSHTQVDSNILKPGTTGIGVIIDPASSATVSYPIIRGNKVTAGANALVMPASGTCTGMVIESNDLRGASTKVSGSLPSGTRLQFNLGYVSEIYGVTGAIATGATVTHGITGTPAVVHVTALDSGPTDIYVSSIGATTFAVNYGGGGTHVFAWTARLAATYA